LRRESKERVKIIAEIGANHEDDPEILVETVKAAKSQGADYVKLQLYTPSSMAIDHPEAVCDQWPWFGERRVGIDREGMVDRDVMIPPFLNAVTEIKMPWIASVFSGEDMDFAMSCAPRPAMLKIASLENGDVRLIKRAAAQGVPLIISTGTATQNEIIDAMEAGGRAPRLIMLHCVTCYPTRPFEADLRGIDRKSVV
jgi:sialic acid synthase SpsE